MSNNALTRWGCRNVKISLKLDARKCPRQNLSHSFARIADEKISRKDKLSTRPTDAFYNRDRLAVFIVRPADREQNRSRVL